MPRSVELTGQQFNRLTAIRRTGKSTSSGVLWLCQCQCGQQIEVAAHSLRTGNTGSCGCLHKEAIARRNRLYPLKGKASPFFKHGHTLDYKTSPEYESWRGMKERCFNPKNKKYADYGGRGITVCSRWADPESGFSDFLADMGKRPEGLTLDRIRVNEGYSPSNCRWATWSEQMKNRRPSRKTLMLGSEPGDRFVQLFSEYQS